MGLDWNRITWLHSQVMTGTHELSNSIYQEIDTTPKPLTGIREAHVGGMGSTHLCSKACLNIPTQSCANVCGVTVAVLGAVACTIREL